MNYKVWIKLLRKVLKKKVKYNPIKVYLKKVTKIYQILILNLKKIKLT